MLSILLSVRTPLCLILFFVVVGGCAQRDITINSEPPGAMVYVNDQEIGRTPLTRDFQWYGTYDVQLRKEGYETENRHATIVAQPWFWPPFDLFVELLPFHVKDHRERTFVLHPATSQPVDQTIMLSRAADLAAKLQSSEHTRPATTYPSTTEPTE